MTTLRKILGILIVVGMFLNCSSIACADIAPLPRVPRCVKIDNINQWTEYYLIGYVSWLGSKVEAYIIEQDECLEKSGYKFNQFKIYAMPKSYVDSRGLHNLDPGTDENAVPVNVYIELNGTLASEDETLLSEEITYSIIDITDDELILEETDHKAIRSVVQPGDNIQAAIEAADDGAVITVEPGTYKENINFSGKAITVKSIDPDNPSVVASTIIDGDHVGSVVTFDLGEDHNSVLNGFTIRNGMAEYGAGIFCAYASPTITNCKITGNEAFENGDGYSGHGGGIYCLTLCEPIITNCAITGNSAFGDGGGIYNDSGSNMLTITNCTITGNEAFGDGGGIYCPYTMGTTITNCTISGNSASNGGGIFGGEAIQITNSILWDNIPDEIFGAGSEVYGSISVTYSCIRDTDPGTSNISDDPLFVNPLFGNYRLQSDSPCVDKGTDEGAPDRDKDGRLRPWGEGYDMGAYEFELRLCTANDQCSEYEYCDMLCEGGDLGEDLGMCVQGQTSIPGMYCPCNWDPVCGCDGKTYSNPCFAMLAGVKIAHNCACGDESCAENNYLSLNAPIVTGETSTYDTTPTWTWESDGLLSTGSFRYMLDNDDFTTGGTETTETLFIPSSPLSEGEHTLYVQEQIGVSNMSGDKYWSGTGSKTITIEKKSVSLTKHLPTNKVSYPGIMPSAGFNFPSMNTSFFGMPSFDISSFTMPSFGIPSFDILSFTMPSFGIPSFGLSSFTMPSLGISSLGLPLNAMSTFVMPSFNFPLFSMPLFGGMSSFDSPFFTGGFYSAFTGNIPGDILFK